MICVGYSDCKAAFSRVELGACTLRDCLLRTRTDAGSSPTVRGSADLEETSSISLVDGHMPIPVMSTEIPPSLSPTSTSIRPAEPANEAEDGPPSVQPPSDAAKAITIPYKQFVDVVCDWGKRETGAWRDIMEHDAKLLAEGVPLQDIINRQGLQSIKEALGSMSEGGEPAYQYLQHALGPLGDMLRLPDFRAPFGEAGILNFCLDLIVQRGGFPATKNVVRQALRIVGNAVIDNDENRARVIAGNYTKVLIELLKDPELSPLVLYVLNNVCDSNEDAQVQAAQNGLVEALIPTLEPEGNEALTTMAWTLVELASRHAEAIESSPDGILEFLTRLALEPELSIGDFLTLTNALLNYLKLSRFQEAFVKLPRGGAVETVYRIVRYENLEQFSDALPEETQELSRNCLALISAVSDCSDLPIFAEWCPFRRLKYYVLWFAKKNNDTNVQLLGCILAGNYANSEESCREVIEAGVHTALAGVLMESSDARVLHGALGALKNLAIPLAFRTQLAETGIFNAAARIFTMSTMPQAQLVSVSLIRLLITNTLPNISDHLLRSSPAPRTNDPSPLSALLTLFSSTDSLPIQLEIGRTITELFRCLGSSLTPSHQEVVEKAYSHIHTYRTILRPIAAMLTQTQYLSLRSEAIFILALISRRKDGCVAITKLLKDVQVFEVLVGVLTGKGKGESGEGLDFEVGAKDRENAIVLGVEIVRNGESSVWLGEEELGVLLKGKEGEEGKVEGVYEALERRVEDMKKGGGTSGRIAMENEE